VIVVALHLDRGHYLALFQVIGDVEKATDEDSVASDPFGEYVVTRTAGRQAARYETAFGAARNDNGILHLLCLDQTQHFGAVVLFPIRPAQPATRNLAAAQMYPLDAWRIDEYLVQRRRPGHLRNRPRLKLEAEIALGFAVGVELVEVGAQGRFDQRQVTPKDAVFVEHSDVVQRAQNRDFQTLLLVCQVFLAQLSRQVEASLEQAHQLAGYVGVIEQRVGDVAKIETHANLLEVASISSQ